MPLPRSQKSGTAAPPSCCPSCKPGTRSTQPAKYDWTSYEPEDTTGHSAVWQEQLTIGDTPSRVAVGINHAGQAHNDLLSLLAGTLLDE
jgi:hypothetical protein